MCWEVLAQRLPPEGALEAPEGDLTTRAEVIARLRALAPEAETGGPGRWLIEGAGYSIEVSVGEEEELGAVSLHVRGASEEAARRTLAIVHALGMQAFDPQAGAFLTSGAQAAEAFRAWREHDGEQRG